MKATSALKKVKVKMKTNIINSLKSSAYEFAQESNYIFDCIFARGNKLKLAKSVDLEKEEKTVDEDNKNDKKSRKNWERNARHWQGYVKGYDKTPLFCQIYTQKKHCKKWVIVVHGYGGDGYTLVHSSKRFHDEGYNVVVPDLRGHGKSGGDYVGMGFADTRDIINIIYMIIKGDKNAEIYLYGVSMGAAAVLMTSAERLPKNVKAAISDCSYDSLQKIISYEIKHKFKLPSIPVLNTINIMYKKRTGQDLRLASPVKSVKNIRIPILYIHGEKDDFVPLKMTKNLYRHTKSPKALMIIQNAGHGVSALVDSERYWRGVFKFLTKSTKAS